MPNPFKPNTELQAKFDAASTENDALAIKVEDYEEVMKTDAQAIADFQISEVNLKAELVTANESIATITARPPVELKIGRHGTRKDFCDEF